jgi:hypothetical protein
LAGESACPTLLGRPDEYWLFCMTHYTSSREQVGQTIAL